MVQKKQKIEGVSDELNSIVSQNLDHAPARRRVRSAFTNIQQQLDHILFKWYEKISKGQEIFCKSWLPKSGVRIRGALCFCHGYGDTYTFFFEGIAKHIASLGYGVYAMDHPSFGLLEGLHGYVSSFDGVVDNVIAQDTIIKGSWRYEVSLYSFLDSRWGEQLLLRRFLRNHVNGMA
ncbi:caffeoylshikimate esterase-like isoform X2 [Olea europaea var. sylvestris]|uniref:caffeoylshikimate esterase-like isoform X2 n=1 Tax=Olea europaea var. sylvestris TaxID=158386 RepID=UPI000C1D0882|nr:caffeoylshikimate esterase-like isoform X2 [Olea europaea var. sylvestris]